MSYSLATSYAGESLLSGFNWYNGDDLSNGYVSYQSREDASAKQIFTVDETTQVVRLGVDSTNTFGLDQGRPSIRLESKESYDHGLFIADFLHMPPSQCGLWPAFWMYGSDWPYGGELDIIEGANTAHRNVISAHTADGCFQDETSMFTGEQRNTDCAIGTQNIGCGFNPPAEDTSSYGDAFNAVGGGVYAVQWDSDRMKVWHFARGSVPADIDAKKPEPSGWGVPQAVFGGEKCDVDSFFKNMSIVININFCGDYGDATWGASDTCGSLAPTCSEYVANNPEAFSNAYWDVKYIDAYQLQAGDVVVEPAVVTPTIPADHPMNRGPVNPKNIDAFAYLGCFSSDSGFSTFTPGEDTQEMTLERCVESCSGASHTYAGVFQSQCFCADDVDATTRAVEDESQCTSPCPGNAQELCGGGDASARLFSIYGGVADEEAPQPPPMAGPASTLTVVICPTDVPGATDASALPEVIPPMATPGLNRTVVPPPPAPANTPTAAASTGLIPDVRLSAWMSFAAIAFVLVI